MKLVVCTSCDRRAHECACDTASWESVELYTPAEVEARMHRLLGLVVERSPSSRAVCAGLPRVTNLMKATNPPEKSGRVATVSDRDQTRRRFSAGKKLA